MVHCYGDESGTLRNVLHGDEEVFVLAVVAGGQFDCEACPKRAVRQVQDLPEARWTDLTDVQKRRLVDCFLDRRDDLEFGRVVIERETLLDLEGHHLLFDDSTFDTDWDLLAIGHGCRELLSALPVPVTGQIRFRFDNLSSSKTSDEVLALLEARWPELDADYDSSRRTRGIQAADCFAGPVAEDHKKGTTWCEFLDDVAVVDVAGETLIQLERLLHDERAGP